MCGGLHWILGPGEVGRIRWVGIAAPLRAMRDNAMADASSDQALLAENRAEVAAQ